MKRNRQLAALLLVVVCLTTSGQTATQVDTSAVREPEAPRRSFGQTILNVPALVVKAPVKLLKGFARIGLKIGYEQSAARVFIAKVFGTNRPLHPLISYGSKPSLEGGLGLRLRDLFSPDDQIRAKAWYSINQYQRYEARYEAPFLFGEHTGFTIRADYQKMPRESFYGLGNESRDSDEASITREPSTIGGELYRRVGRNILLELATTYNSHNLYDGEETALITDLGAIADTLGLTDDAFRSCRFLAVEGRIWLDWRSNKGQPTRGGTQDISLRYSRGTGISSGLAFWDLRLDLWQHFHLFRQRTLAVRVLVRSIDILNDRDDLGLPYYLLPALGGEGDLRGYRRNRLIGRGLSLATLEYRYPLWRHGDGFIFVDEGRVFDSFRGDFTFRDWRYSYGIGIRAWHAGGEFFRLTAALSKEEIRFYFNFGQDL